MDQDVIQQGVAVLIVDRPCLPAAYEGREKVSNISCVYQESLTLGRMSSLLKGSREGRSRFAGIVESRA